MSCRTGIFGTVSGLLMFGAATLSGGMLSGCSVPAAATNDCTLKSGVVPATAIADHAAAAPGNQQAFNVGFVPPFPTGCAVPAFVTSPQNFTWVSSDPVNAPISNAKDATAGVATCVGATTVPVTISINSNATVTVATLTCK